MSATDCFELLYDHEIVQYKELVSSSIRRNRFLKYSSRYLHLCDNTNLPQNDKFAKVRKYFSM